MPNVLIIGIDSTIGRILQDIFGNGGWSVFGTTRRESNVTERIFYLNLTNIAEWNITQRMDAVFLCAGVTKQSSCRQYPEYSRVINLDAQLQLANYFINQGAQIIYLSSNSVFDGSKSKPLVMDKVCPVTLHGEYKAAVEKMLLSFACKVSIVRLTKVLTSNYPLILQWIQSLKTGEVIRPFHDLWISPISIKSVGNCLKEVVERKQYGIIHLSGDDDVTYLDIANYCANSLRANKSLIKPRSVLDSGPLLEKVPRYTSLDMTESSRLYDTLDVSYSTTMGRLYGDILSPTHASLAD